MRKMHLSTMASSARAIAREMSKFFVASVVAVSPPLVASAQTAEQVKQCEIGESDGRLKSTFLTDRTKVYPATGSTKFVLGGPCTFTIKYRAVMPREGYSGGTVEHMLWYFIDGQPNERKIITTPSDAVAFAENYKNYLVGEQHDIAVDIPEGEHTIKVTTSGGKGIYYISPPIMAGVPELEPLIAKESTGNGTQLSETDAEPKATAKAMLQIPEVHKSALRAGNSTNASYLDRNMMLGAEYAALSFAAGHGNKGYDQFFGVFGGIPLIPSLLLIPSLRYKYNTTATAFHPNPLIAAEEVRRFTSLEGALGVSLDMPIGRLFLSVKPAYSSLYLANHTTNKKGSNRSDRKLHERLDMGGTVVYGINHLLVASVNVSTMQYAPATVTIDFYHPLSLVSGVHGDGTVTGIRARSIAQNRENQFGVSEVTLFAGSGDLTIPVAALLDKQLVLSAAVAAEAEGIHDRKFTESHGILGTGLSLGTFHTVRAVAIMNTDGSISLQIIGTFFGDTHVRGEGNSRETVNGHGISSSTYRMYYQH